MARWNPGTSEWGCSLTLNLYDDPWKIKKVLTDSDTSYYISKLTLPTRLVEDLVLPALGVDAQRDAQTEEGTLLEFWDVDTESHHHVVLKRKRSYVITGKWIQDFVRRRGLNGGDEIGLQWDPYNDRFNFSVLKRA